METGGGLGGHHHGGVSAAHAAARHRGQVHVRDPLCGHAGAADIAGRGVLDDAGARERHRPAL